MGAKTVQPIAGTIHQKQFRFCNYTRLVIIKDIAIAIHGRNTICLMGYYNWQFLD